MGNTRYITDSTGNAVTESYLYDAFGNVLSSSGTTPATFQYKNEQVNNVSGLQMMGARMYDPTVGEFLSPDPLTVGVPPLLDLMNPLSLDPYLFADNNPITGMDPTGLMTFDFVHGGFAETWSGNTAQEIHADASLAWFASAADPAYRKFLQAAADALEGLAGPAAGPLGGWAQGQIPSPGDTETTPWNSTPSLDGSGDQR